MKLTKDLFAFVWRDPRANNCNTYVVSGGLTLLIDPGHAAYLRRLEQEMARQGLDPRKVGLVIATHAHPDHMEGAEAFGRLSARVAIHEEEAAFAGPLQDAFYRSQGFSPPNLAFSFFLREGDLKVGDHTFQVLHTPGHSPGSVVLYWPEEKALFTGDVLFAGGLGRTDLPGGNGAKLKESIRRLEALDVEWLLPGHGDVLKGKEAVEKNFQAVKATYFDYI